MNFDSPNTNNSLDRISQATEKLAAVRIELATNPTNPFLGQIKPLA